MKRHLPRAGGFTLVEVVVALSLVSLIMLGLMAALGTFASTASRLDRRALQSDDIRLVYAFVRTSLSSASPRIRTDARDLAHTTWFYGEAGAIEWLGLMPARHGAGGLYHLRLAHEPAFGPGHLVLQYLPYTDDASPPDWAAAHTHMLLDDVKGFSVAYQGLGSSEWRSSWRNRDVLPGRIGIHITLGDGTWPELMVHPAAAEAGRDDDAPPMPGRQASSR